MKGRVKGGPLAEGSKNLSPDQDHQEWKDAVGVVRVLVMRCSPKMPPRQWNENEHFYYSALDVVNILKR
jgi:hypothetical protein